MRNRTQLSTTLSLYKGALPALGFLAALFLWSPAPAAEAPALPARERLLVVFPHPGDETRLPAESIRAAVSAGAWVKVVFLTHGDCTRPPLGFLRRPLIKRSDYLKAGTSRREEALASCAALGVAPGDAVFLGYPDSGLIRMWFRHWGTAKPYKSVLTRISKAPYKDEPSYGTPYKSENLLQDLSSAIADFKPTVVLAPSSEDANQDHKAAYLFVTAAIGGSPSAPRVERYAVHPKKSRDTDAAEYSVDGANLLISADIFRHPDEVGALTFDAFGWRKDAPFGRMPKIEMRLLGRKMYVLDGRRRVDFSGIVFRESGKRVEIRVPLKLLGDPDGVFTSARAAAGGSSYEIAPWKYTLLKPDSQPEAVLL